MAIFGRFTEGAQRALSESQRVAAGLHQPYVGTEHLLMGLIRTDKHLVPEISTKVEEQQV